MISEELLSILACPQCKGAVVLVSENGANWLDCAQCKLRYPIQDDIPVMLIEKASKYS